MNFPRLQITQTNIKMALDVQRPTYLFEPSHTHLLLEQKPAEMLLNPTPSKLTIDQRQCWADMDLKHIFQRITEAAEDGKQEALEYIARVTAEGEQMGAIENKGNVIRQIAATKRMLPEYHFTYGNIPGNFSLKMTFTPGELNMDWKIGGTSVDVQTVPFQHHYEKGRISYTIQQKNELHFHVAGENVNTSY
jgi:hypothetical protein